jgi:hypothetical protein
MFDPTLQRYKLGVKLDELFVVFLSAKPFVSFVFPSHGNLLLEYSEPIGHEVRKIPDRPAGGRLFEVLAGEESADQSRVTEMPLELDLDGHGNLRANVTGVALAAGTVERSDNAVDTVVNAFPPEEATLRYEVNAAR